MVGSARCIREPESSTNTVCVAGTVCLVISDDNVYVKGNATSNLTESYVARRDECHGIETCEGIEPAYETPAEGDGNALTLRPSFPKAEPLCGRSRRAVLHRRHCHWSSWRETPGTVVALGLGSACMQKTALLPGPSMIVLLRVLVVGNSLLVGLVFPRVSLLGLRASVPWQFQPTLEAPGPRECRRCPHTGLDGLVNNVFQ